ncbi:unnamed protein product [Phytophthora fragariaefolia]|uniref:Unnamed protein product n=1 Tax=Phytophthora fragariaefolia TaxID=1490495 RepID=A0A9W6WUP9_9STRA|nr:unnamed protein product [Phytophthora fragariaefolia]
MAPSRWGRCGLYYWSPAVGDTSQTSAWDQDTEDNDNYDDLFYCAIALHRYLASPEVVKTGIWSPGRIIILNPSAAGMNQSQQTFRLLVRPAASSERSGYSNQISDNGERGVKAATFAGQNPCSGSDVCARSMLSLVVVMLGFIIPDSGPCR